MMCLSFGVPIYRHMYALFKPKRIQSGGEHRELLQWRTAHLEISRSAPEYTHYDRDYALYM